MDHRSPNPYESPATGQGAGCEQPENRRAALRSFRAAFLILLAPALFNYYAFDTHTIAALNSPRLQVVYRATNLLGFVVGSFLLWFVAFPLLEIASRAIRNRAASDVAVDRWDDALYASLKPAVYLAVPGAVLWALWVVAFYFLQLDFVVISYVVGVPAHILAAGIYIPLACRWYRLLRSESQPAVIEQSHER